MTTKTTFLPTTANRRLRSPPNRTPIGHPSVLNRSPIGRKTEKLF